MRKLMLASLAAATLCSAGAYAQQTPQMSADDANAASMPMQGTDTALATPGAEPRAYPLCSRSQQDECVNPREAGANHGRVPLNYWPGRPASEMR